MCPMALKERFEEPALLRALNYGIDEVKTQDRLLMWIPSGGFAIVSADK